MVSDFSDYDVASAIWKGMRPYQEDSLSTDFHAGLPQGFAIIADGMGGHAAGDVASNLAAVQGAGHLKIAMQAAAETEDDLPAELRSAIEKANASIADRVAGDSRVSGMGTTMLAVALVENRLYWGSVGDSPLYLIRDGALRQLNQDHSMAPVIASMVERGEITPEQGKQHPDRNALTSVLMGEPIQKSDVPATGFELMADDVLIAASDGLQFLENDQILDRVQSVLPASSSKVCSVLMDALKDLADPHQDNAALVVIQRRTADLEVKDEAVHASSQTSEPHEPRTRIVADEPLDDAPSQQASQDGTDDPSDEPVASPKYGSSGGEATGVSSPGQSILFLLLGLAAIAAVAFFLR